MNDQLLKCLEIGNCFEFMPDSDGTHFQSELSSLFLKHEIKDSVTFFGGSFNPFHQGHLACLDLCPEKNILIVPDRNPFKDIALDKNIYDDFIRLATFLRDTRYSLYPGFLAMLTKNPTSRWLPLVRIKEKNLLMGDDSYMSLLSWHHPELILKSLTKLYVVPRTFNKADYVNIEQQLLSINPSLVVHYLDEHPYMNLSSTKLR